METGLEGKSDAGVVLALHEAVRTEGAGIARVVRCLMEFLRRRLIGKMPHPSIFEYCTDRLGYSRAAAYKRTRAAQAAEDHPELLRLLETRQIDLSRLVAVTPHLTPQNKQELLRRACTMTQHELEFFLAGLHPRPVPRDVVRTLTSAQTAPPQSAQPGQPALPTAGTPAPAAESEGEPASPPPTPLPHQPQSGVEALTESLARVYFTADAETLRKLDRACALMRCGRANVGVVIARALDMLLEEIDPDLKLAVTETAPPPRASNLAARRIPQHVKRAVWQRDGGRCAFEDADGARCSGTTGLEFDHIKPWSAGGGSCDPDNIRLLCRQHNQAAARDWFGNAHVERAMALRRSEREAPS